MQVLVELICCAKCGQDKGRNEYSTCKRKKNGLQSYCKQCTSDYVTRYTYGLSNKSVQSLVVDQQGRCLICDGGLNLQNRTSWMVDHNHSSGEVRGVLCRSCNIGLGLFQDSPRLLAAAGRYLQERGHYGDSHAS